MFFCIWLNRPQKAASVVLLITVCALAIDFLYGYWYWRRALKTMKKRSNSGTSGGHPNQTKRRRSFRRGSFVSAHGHIPHATQSFEDAHSQPEEDHKLPSMVLSRLTFQEWLYYYRTLRLEHVYDKGIQFGCYLWYKWRGLLERTVSEEEAQILLPVEAAERSSDEQISVLTVILGGI